MLQVKSVWVRVPRKKMCTVYCVLVFLMCLFSVAIFKVEVLHLSRYSRGPNNSHVPQILPGLWLGTLDSTGDYMVTVFSVVGSSWKELNLQPIGLATQASVEHLSWIVDTLTNWTGPVSVAIFVPDVDLHVASQFVSHLTACYPSIATQVSFHFVYPVTRPPRTLPGSHPDVGNCSRKHKGLLKKLLQLRPAKMMKWRNNLLYPQNLLRNTARRTLTTQYFICPDVDMIPSRPTLASELGIFLTETATNCSRCAFIVPVYELPNKVDTPPINKTQLLEYRRSARARVYQVTVWKPNQGPSNLSYWETIAEEPTLRALYKVQYGYLFEPIYVAHRSAPLYDERFIGYGYTRSSQIVEMYMGSWDFYVLNNAFLVHWGYEKAYIRVKSRTMQTEMNKEIFPFFLRELVVRYDRYPPAALKKFGKVKTKIMLQDTTNKVPSPKKTQ